MSDESAGSHLKSTLLLLRAYAKTYKRIDIGFEDFVIFVEKYVDQYGGQYKQLQVFEKNPKQSLSSNLKTLEEKNQCKLRYEDSRIDRIEFSQFLFTLLEKAYSEMEKNPDLPFPTEESIGLHIPPDQIIALDIQNGFPNYLKGGKKDGGPIIRLIFPEDLGSILMTRDRVPKPLLNDSIQKIKSYLGRGNNASYVHTRLRAGFINNPNLLRELINNVIVKPAASANSLAESSDLTFRFWANLTNLITNEYKEKKDLLVAEQNICISGYLLGVFNIYYRELSKNEADQKKNAMANLEVQLRKPPYLYSLNDIYGIKDSKGRPLVSQETKEAVLKFLEKKMRPKAKQIIPDVIRIKTEGNEYYLNKEMAPTVFVKRLQESTEELRDHYVEKWVDALWRDEEPEAMQEDRTFIQDLANIVRSYYPILRYFLNYNLLTGIEKETQIRHNLLPEYDRCLDRKNFRLKPLDEILRLDRKNLVRNTKDQMPIWGKFKLTRKIGLMLTRWFKGLGRRPRQSPASSQRRTAQQPATSTVHSAAGGQAKIVFGAKAPATKSKSKPVDARVAYKKKLLELKEQLIGEGRSIPQALDEMIEKWNPLFDPKARKNLIEDVNSMVRDYMRGLRRGFRVSPPDVARIRALASKLSQNEVFDRIKQKEHFKRYIEVYMLKLLGEK
jgi:hypothetical protein